MMYSLLSQSGTGSSLMSRMVYLHKYREPLAAMALMLMLMLACAAFVGAPVVHAQEAATAVAPVATVNINTADASSLAAALKGVGESRAQDIVRYREAYGPFASAEELMEVKGIGQSTLDTNLKVITLE